MCACVAVFGCSDTLGAALSRWAGSVRARHTRCMGAGNRMSAKWVAALTLSLRLRPGQTALELRGRQSV